MQSSTRILAALTAARLRPLTTTSVLLCTLLPLRSIGAVGEG
jgi:hypothetical protein